MIGLILPRKKNIWSHVLKKAYLSCHSDLPFRCLANKGDMVVHVGVWKIETVASWCKCVGLGGKVIVIEPVPENVNILRFECGRRGLKNVLFVQKGAWFESGETAFMVHQGMWQYDKGSGERSFDPTMSFMHSRPKATSTFIDDDAPEAGVSYEECTVEVDTLADILNGLGVKRPNHVHITVTGSEWEVLQGARPLFSIPKISFMVSSTFPVKETGKPGHVRIRRLLKSYGLSTCTGKAMRSRCGRYVYACRL